jgi:hypothetical protein
LIGIGFVLGVGLIPVCVLVGPKLMRPAQRVPGFDTRMSGCPYPGADVAELFEDFLGAWLLWGFGSSKDCDRLRAALHALNIRWRSGDSFTDESRRKLRGLTRSLSQIEVAAREPLGVRQTALAHELVHVALGVLCHDADHDHASGNGPWTKRHDEMVESLKR